MGEGKRAANVETHGLDFADVLSVFDDPQALCFEDARRGYGERRFALIARLETRYLHVTCTLRRGAIRLISARRANRRERERYARRHH